MFAILFQLALIGFGLTLETLPSNINLAQLTVCFSLIKESPNYRHFFPLEEHCIVSNTAAGWKYRWIQNEWHENVIYCSLYNLTDQPTS